MKKTLLAAVMLFICALGHAAVDADGIAVGISVPDFDDNFDSTASKTLVNKLTELMSKSGLASTASDFVVCPKITVANVDLVEGGMKNIFVIEGDIALDIVQMSTGKVFGSTSMELKGSGMRNKAAAVKDAVRNLRGSNPKIASFFSDTRNKIATYYKQNRSAILSKARAAKQRHAYDEAIAILATYPEGLEGYEEIDRELVAVMKAYREQNCEQAVMQARAAIAVKNYDLALEVLSEVDPDSDCAMNATALMTSVNREIRNAEAQDRADALAEKKAERDMQKARLEAARDVAKAYYQRTQPTYNVIFR